MRFSIDVGEAEKSRIEFSRNWFTGAMRTLVDGVQVAQQSPLAPSTHFATTKTRQYEFTVGRTEKHRVVLERERPMVLAGLRPQTYRVFVDGALRHQRKGY